MKEDNSLSGRRGERLIPSHWHSSQKHIGISMKFALKQQKAWAILLSLLITVILAYANPKSEAIASRTSVRGYKHHRAKLSPRLKALNEQLILTVGDSFDGNIQGVKLLLDRGAQINAQDEFGRTALTQAVINHHPEIVRYLLRRGANVNLYARGSAVGSQLGGTALMFAEENEKFAKSSNYDPQEHHLVPIYHNIIGILKKAGAKEHALSFFEGSP